MRFLALGFLAISLVIPPAAYATTAQVNTLTNRNNISGYGGLWDKILDTTVNTIQFITDLKYHNNYAYPPSGTTFNDGAFKSPLTLIDRDLTIEGQGYSLNPINPNNTADFLNGFFILNPHMAPNDVSPSSGQVTPTPPATTVSITLKNLILKNCKVQGGNSYSYNPTTAGGIYTGGGAGLGAGGAVFVGPYTNVTLENVSIDQPTAKGGDAGDTPNALTGGTASSGAGLNGGNVGNSGVLSAAGLGGQGNGGAGGIGANGYSGAGAIRNSITAQRGGASVNISNYGGGGNLTGNDGDGGGIGATSGSLASGVGGGAGRPLSSSASGIQGGFGGGGSASGAGGSQGGKGGFGGGGGYCFNTGGNGGFGGGGSWAQNTVGTGGFAGGDSASGLLKGGGGAALGAGIFVYGKLTVQTLTGFNGGITNPTLIPGIGANPGKTFGSAIFIKDMGQLTFNLAANSSYKIGGSIAAEPTGSNGTTLPSITKTGAGTLIIDADSNEKYTGSQPNGSYTYTNVNLVPPMTVNQGVLQINNKDYLGDLTINSGATLQGSGTVGNTSVTVTNGTVIPTDTLHMNGDYTHNGGSFEGTISNGGGSQLTATGDIVFNNTTFNINVTGNPSNHTLLSGNSLTVTNPTYHITPNFYEPTLGGNGTLTLTNNNSNSTNSGGVAVATDVTDATSAAVNTLVNMSDGAEVEIDEEDFLPKTYLEAAELSIPYERPSLSFTTPHPLANPSQGKICLESLAHALAKKKPKSLKGDQNKLWFSPIYTQGKNKKTVHNEQSQDHSETLIAGLEHRDKSKEHIIGFLVGAGMGETESRANKFNNTKHQLLEGGLYGSFGVWKSLRCTVQGIYARTYSKNQRVANQQQGLLAHSNSEIETYNFSMILANKWKWNNFSLRANYGVSIGQSIRGAYYEKDAGIFNLKFPRLAVHTLEHSMGLGARQTFHLKDFSVKVTGMISYSYDAKDQTINDRVFVNSGPQGGVPIKIDKPGRQAFSPSLNLSVKHKPSNFKIDVGYKADLKENRTAQTFVLKLSTRF